MTDERIVAAAIFYGATISLPPPARHHTILHAEANALMFAKGGLEGSTLVVTHPCCAQCASLAIQAGVKHIIWPRPHSDFAQRWAEDMLLTYRIFYEAGVEITEVH